MRSSRFSVSEKVSSSSLVRSRRSRLRHPEVAGVVVERLLDGQEPVEVQLLRRQADRQARLLVVVDRVVAEDPDRARGRLREPGRAVDQRRLAGAVRAEQAEELARLDLERDAAQRLDPGRVALDQILDVEGVHRKHAIQGAYAAQAADGVCRVEHFLDRREGHPDALRPRRGA